MNRLQRRVPLCWTAWWIPILGVPVLAATFVDSPLSDPSDPASPVVVDITPPVITAPATVQMSLDTPVTILSLASDIVPTGVQITDDSGDTTAQPSGDLGPFAPGTHVITWTATDPGNNTHTVTQTLTLLPSVNLGVDQTVGEGNDFTVTAYLNGPAPLDVTLPYTVTGTATQPADHTAVAGNITITAGNSSGSVTFATQLDGIADDGETVIFTLGTPVNAIAGPRTTHTVTISETNHAPLARPEATQNSLVTRMVTVGGGIVTVAANARDIDPGTTLNYDWSATDNALVPLTGTHDSSFQFDPAGLAPGLYKLHVSVSDGTVSSAHDVLLNVIATAPSLSASTDSDDDKLADSAEGIADNNGDGIADYLVPITDTALLPGWAPLIFRPGLAGNGSTTAGNIHLAWQTGTTASNKISYPLLIATEPGLRLALGETAFRLGQVHARVATGTANQLLGVTDSSDVTSSDGYVADFEIHGLTHPGQGVRVVIPQPAPLMPSTNPAPTYRVFQSAHVWTSFTSDANNSVASATRLANGYCPPPGDASYVTGITATHQCVELLIEDGGPNDSDGSANGVVRNLGAVFIAAPAAPPGNGSSGTPIDPNLDTFPADPLPHNAGSGAHGGGGTLEWLSLLGLLLARGFYPDGRRRFRAMPAALARNL